jgi:DNA-binding transcriptional regulator YdaS (Cro superfamily)
MELSAFLKHLTPDSRKAFAKRAKTTVPYLYQLAGKHRAPSPLLAKRIEQASDGRVPKEKLRADVYGDRAA